MSWRRKGGRARECGGASSVRRFENLSECVLLGPCESNLLRIGNELPIHAFDCLAAKRGPGGFPVTVSAARPSRARGTDSLGPAALSVRSRIPYAPVIRSTGSVCPSLIFEGRWIPECPPFAKNAKDGPPAPLHAPAGRLEGEAHGYSHSSAAG